MKNITTSCIALLLLATSQPVGAENPNSSASASAAPTLPASAQELMRSIDSTRAGSAMLSPQGMGGSASANPHGAMMNEAAQSPKPSWTKPARWTERAPTSIRVGNFEITGANQQRAQVSVVPLGGPAGGEVANINLWRQQIGLPSLSDADALALITRLKLPAGEFALVDMVGKEGLIDGKFRPHIIAAIQKREAQTWFFKLVGEDQTVTAAKAEFVEFLGSVKFPE